MFRGDAASGDGIDHIHMAFNQPGKSWVGFAHNEFAKQLVILVHG
jgi:hypothetical protein